MSARPKYPKTDRNHTIIREYVNARPYYRGLKLDCLDISRLGGRSVDWILWLGPLAIAVEVKQDDDPYWSLTDGEKQFMDECPGLKALVMTCQDIEETLANCYDVACLVNKYKRKDSISG